MPFETKPWKNEPTKTTPITAGALVDLEERVAGYTDLLAPFINVKAYGAKGDGIADDTAAIQKAIEAASGGTVYFPFPSVGYKVTASLKIGQSTCRHFIGGPAKIIYTGTGYCFKAEASEPAVPSTFISNIQFDKLTIDGNSEATATGGINLSGVFNCNVGARMIIQNFTNAASIGVNIADSFNVSVNAYINTVKTCASLSGSSEQLTQISFGDNFLFHPSSGGVGISVSPTILGEGLRISGGAIKIIGGGVGLEMTGKFADIRLGPNLHFESTDEVASNTNKAISLTGTGLNCGSMSIEDVDFYNIKTLCYMRVAGGGIIKSVRVGNVYATGLESLAGTVFDLNGMGGGPVMFIGPGNVASAQYTTFLENNGTAGQFLRAPYTGSALPTPASQNQSQMFTVTQNANGDQTYINQRTPGGTAYVFQRVVTAPATTKKSATYEATLIDRVIIVTSGTFTLTLKTTTDGDVKHIRNNGAGTITVAASSGSVNGTTSLTEGKFATYACDGTNWYQIA